MGRRRERDPKSQAQTLPSSPARSFSSSSSSSSSSDFEFTISLSPHRPGRGGGAGGGGGDSTVLCPADELFYKGQLLPLHLSPRLSMVRTLLLASSSSSDSALSSSRNSSADCDSSSGRPSSAAADDELPKPTLPQYPHDPHALAQAKRSRHFSLARFSSVFCPKARPDPSSVKRVSATARDVIRKYLRMVKPFYEKLSSPKQQQQQKMAGCANGVVPSAAAAASVWGERRSEEIRSGGYSHSFSGNKRYPRMRGHVASCPSSIRSSPNHAGNLGHGGRFGPGNWGGSGEGYASGTTSSSMEELQNAIQGAIAYCKSSMLQQPGLVSNEI